MWLYYGLTGNVACGKSTVAKFFEEFGCHILDADEISRSVMKRGGSAFNKVVSAFGQNVLGSDGELDRMAMRKIVFSDIKERKKLESIVHPAILEEERRLIGRIKGKKTNGIIITQAALSVESGSYKRFDGLIIVYAEKNQQMQRLLKRDGITKEMAENMIKSQMPYEKKVKYAEFIVDNSGNLEQTKEDTNRVFNILTQKHFAMRMDNKEQKTKRTLK